MSDLNPPSQTRPGPRPGRRRTAILWADGPSPRSMKSSTASGIASVMERLLWSCGLSCSAGGAAVLALVLALGTLAEQMQGVYVPQRADGRDRNTSHLRLFRLPRERIACRLTYLPAQ